MEKKLSVIRTLFAICGIAGVYIAVYLLVVSGLLMIPGCADMNLMYLNALGMAMAAVAVYLLVRGEELTFKIEKKPVLQIVAVILLAYSTSAFFNVLLGVIPWDSLFDNKVTPDEATFFGIPLWARMLCYEVVAPVSEELLFRQAVYKKMRKISPVWLAALTSAGLFGIYHGNLVQGIYAFIMGLFLALVYEWTGSFTAPVLFHMVANHLSDITYEFETVGKVVYSPYGAAVSFVCILVTMYILIKNKNKCSKNELRSA